MTSRRFRVLRQWRRLVENLKSEDPVTARLRTWWAGHSIMVLRCAILLMAAAALVWLGYEFWRLLWAPIWPASLAGAVDLLMRYDEVHRWFAGEPVYSELKNAVY